MHRENVYAYNLVGFKKKVNTFERIKSNVRSFVPNLLIKLSQVWDKFGPNDVKSLNYCYYSFAFILLVCSTIVFFFVQVLSYCHFPQT